MLLRGLFTAEHVCLMFLGIQSLFNNATGQYELQLLQVHKHQALCSSKETSILYRTYEDCNRNDKNPASLYATIGEGIHMQLCRERSLSKHFKFIDSPMRL